MNQNEVNQNRTNFENQNENSAHGKLENFDERKKLQVNKNRNYQDSRNYGRFDENRRSQDNRRTTNNIDLEEFRRNEENRRFEALEAARKTEIDKKHFEEVKIVEQTKRNEAGQHRLDDTTRKYDDHRPYPNEHKNFNQFSSNQETPFQNRPHVEENKKKNHVQNASRNVSNAAYGVLYNSNTENI